MIKVRGFISCWRAYQVKLGKEKVLSDDFDNVTHNDALDSVAAADDNF